MVPAKNPASARNTYLIVGALTLETIAFVVGCYRYSTGRWPIHFDEGLTSVTSHDQGLTTSDEAHTRAVAEVAEIKRKLEEMHKPVPANYVEPSGDVVIRPPDASIKYSDQGDRPIIKGGLPPDAVRVDYSRCVASTTGRTCICFDESNKVIPDYKMETCFRFMNGKFSWKKGDPLPTAGERFVQEAGVFFASSIQENGEIISND